ncbi:Putative stress-induced transcription regulator [Streptosporangium subroseum]|uniref:Putative stress-induced transcription regulator n=1 Tax=Streptosporangium subroseum TaxID=106412 RepID=A0A239KKJ4_9ACTN|nr:Putative stress-induced transcription regulator [Streptosporangium subroseum]
MTTEHAENPLTPAPVDPTALVAARDLREAIYRLARANCDGTGYGRADRELLNQVAAGMPVGVRLDDEPGDLGAGDVTPFAVHKRIYADNKYADPTSFPLA